MTVASPDGNLVVSLALKALPQPYLQGERAYYSAEDLQGKPVLLDSPLGLDICGPAPGHGFRGHRHGSAGGGLDLGETRSEPGARSGTIITN